jgi:hypothetical protein
MPPPQKIPDPVDKKNNPSKKMQKALDSHF